jgi:hypothetical protein
MANQFLKLRRSAVPGRIPSTSSLDFGEIALNTYDGLAFIKKSGSAGEQIVTIGSTSNSFTGSFSGSFIGSFTGSLLGTASYAQNANLLDGKDSTIFATTGSNRFNGNQIITGSLIQGLEGNIATGEYSHAEGSITKATGDYSHAEGDNTQAIGNYSHAEGQDTVALGQYSHAEGYNTITSASYQHVQGQWNATSSVPAAFIVGNGTDNNNRSNLIYAAGNEVQISGSLIVIGSITGSLFGTASWAQNAVTASYVAAANVIGLSLFQIATGSITASVGIGANDLFLIKSGSNTYFNVASNSDATLYSNQFTVKNFTTQQPVLTVSQSIVQFATQSSNPTNPSKNGDIWFTSTELYVGLD